jgi:23S rRNA (cytidine1920-2'-O)/16S rRNA (cytidine1409-2'-O)-methyltransferase
LKLAAALDRFSIPIEGTTCADVGASTGGFTDCLLQRGAAKVYAIDVGYGQLDWKIRSDPRVVPLDRTNARYLEALPEPIDLVTIDASFISLRLILPAALKWLRPDGNVVALIKPQFEAGRDRVGKGGVVRDPEVHADVLRTILQAAEDLGTIPFDLIRSPIEGPAGNIEFLVWLRRAWAGEAPALGALIDAAGFKSTEDQTS